MSLPGQGRTKGPVILPSGLLPAHIKKSFLSIDGKFTPAAPPDGSRQQLLVRAINYFRSREGEPRLFTRRKLVLLALTALYAFSPIDLIPDFIPGVGQIDDLTVIAFTFLALFMPPIREHGSHEDPEP